MPWRVAVVLDQSFDCAIARTVFGYMPLWIADTVANKSCIAELRLQNERWWPDARCTSFILGSGLSSEEGLLCLLETLDRHHPDLSALMIYGLRDSEGFRIGMARAGFLPARSTWSGALAYRKPLSRVHRVKTIVLDAYGWRGAEDFYDAFFGAVGAPLWHGKNFNALSDSIVTGQINTLEVPYTLAIRNLGSTSHAVRTFVQEVAHLISEFEAEGCPVAIELQD